MTPAVQQWVVAVLVVFAAGYVLWRWLPAGVLQRLGWRQAALRNASGCGACSRCSGCASPPGPGALQADDSVTPLKPVQPVFITRSDGAQR